jgi:hypothetical protein
MSSRRIKRYLASAVASLALLAGTAGAALAADLPVVGPRPCLPTDLLQEQGGSNIIAGRGTYVQATGVVTFTMALEAKSCVGITYQLNVYANRTQPWTVQDGDETLTSLQFQTDVTANELTASATVPPTYTGSKVLVVGYTINPQGTTLDRAPDQGDGAIVLCDPSTGDPCSQNFR